MNSKVLPRLVLAFLAIGMLVTEGSAIIANPQISRGKPTFGSPAGGTASLVNGRYKDVSWNVAANAWVAINLGAGPSKVFLMWNNSNYTWSSQMIATPNCVQTLTWPINYEILTSANSTNGTDGQWTTAVTITNNNVTARGHLIDFTGMGWVKIHFTSGGGPIDEIEAFDASNGTEDTWCFAGTSISANTYKNSLTPAGKSFAELIHAAHPACFPAMIRAGIPCINSTDMATHIANYLAIVGNVHYMAIEMGTNDGWNNGTYYLQTFKTNMQTIITACKAKGIQPIIAHPPATDSAKQKWQLDPNYPKCVDTLTTTNNLIAGPDLYGYFKLHPTQLYDGVHPTDSGCTAIQQMWADKMASIYTTIGVDRDMRSRDDIGNAHLRVYQTSTGSLRLMSGLPGNVSMYRLDGTMMNANVSAGLLPRSASGMYLVRIVDESRKAAFSIRR
jgi:lysophospholipase L1-like esterase